MGVTWNVAKVGAPMFDQLHAIGLATLIAHQTNDDVHMVDAGSIYQIEAPTIPKHTSNVSIAELFPLPTSNEVLTTDNVHTATLDGLLALLFTTRGPRVVSVTDLRFQAVYRPETVTNCLQKVLTAITRWQRFVSLQEHDTGDWIIHVIRYYSAFQQQPFQFQPRSKTGGGLGIPMTVDPTFSYGSRQPFSDGMVTKKHSLVITGMPYAAVLAYLGASRWLRAQRVSKDMVNLLVPLISEMAITPQTVLPAIPYRSLSSEQAICERLLASWLTFGSRMKGLTYQTLQTQGAQQSISVIRGCIGSSWLISIDVTLVEKWYRLVGHSQEDNSLKLEFLQGALLGQNGREWLLHLHDYAMQYIYKRARWLPRYQLTAIAGVTKHMDQAQSLRTILENEKGTVRFGFALRQLGKVNASAQREVVEVLDSIHTQQQLLRVLADVNRACLLAKPKSDFIIIPDDTDLAFLLDDISRFGAHEIAGLLIILATLRYPRHDNVEQEPGVDQISTGEIDNE